MTNSPVLSGIAYMVTGMSFIAVVDGIAKYLAQSLNGVEVAWGYFLGIFINLLLYALVTRFPLKDLVRANRLKLQIGRAFCLVLSLSCLYFSLRYLPLADATTISFTSPLFVVALCGPLLKESVGWRRWAAVSCGFIGTVIVVRPGSAVFQWAAVLPLVGAFWFSLFQICTRMIAAADRAITTLFYTTAVGTAIISLAMPFVWTPPTAGQWLILLGLGTLGLCAHLSIIRALTLADASAVAPFNYVRIVWAIALGFILFDDFPDAMTILGGAVIVASGLYIISLETRSHH